MHQIIFLFENHWHENRIRCAVSYDLLLIFHLGYYDVVESERMASNRSIKQTNKEAQVKYLYANWVKTSE